MLDNKTYDRLKFVVLIALPALAAFYLGLSQVWNFPEPEKVGTSIGLLAAFLGTLLQISNSKYKAHPEGYIETQDKGEDDINTPAKITLTDDPETLVKDKEEIRLKVGKAPKPKTPADEIPEY